MSEDQAPEVYTWRPQPGPQTAFVHCTFADEIFFGGARGGGKTDAAIGKLLIKALQYGKGMRGIFFRRTYKQLEEVMLRAHEVFPPHGAKWKEKDLTWTFPNGAWVKFAYLERDQDADNYQGKSFTDIVIEEAGTFPDPKPIWKLKACLRSAKGIPCQMLLTGNPGGPGANWVRVRYIDPAPTGWTPIKEVQIRQLPNGERQAFEATRIYIPSRVTDNQILMQNDPLYISRLMEAGSEQLVKAWLEGDFYVVDGAFFDNWDQRKHVIPQCELPDWWMRWRAADWGSAKPFCNLWMALASEDWQHPTASYLIPKGAIVVYREWYGIKKKPDGTITPNVGVKMYAEEFGAGVLKREGKLENVTFGVMDPSAFAVDGGPSIAERIYRSTKGKVSYRRADNKRTAAAGALAGWDQVRGRLGGEDHKGEGRNIPMLFVMSSCHHLIRTLPMQQHDPDRPEDIDTDGEDHAVDALRYGCMARPYMRPTPTDLNDRLSDLSDVSLDMLWQDRAKQRKRITHERL